MTVAAPWHHVGPTSTNNPFSLFGEGWCTRCRMHVTTTTDSSYGSDTYTISQRCDRCGLVIAFGVYCNIPLFSDSDLPAMALEWVKRPGRDRR